MFKNPNASEEPKSISVIQEEELPVWTPEPTAIPVPLADIKRDLLNLPPHFKAEDLAGHSFDILSLKPFKSSYERQDHAYFATCSSDERIEDGGLFTTVFGGQMLTEVLDAVVKKELPNAISVTLKFVRQGKYNGYYIFE